MNEDNIVLPFHVQQALALSYSQVLVFMVASFFWVFLSHGPLIWFANRHRKYVVDVESVTRLNI